MINILQALLIAVFLLIFYQDIRERMVIWFLYPICGMLSFTIQVLNTSLSLTLIYSAINLAFITIILSVAYFYSKAVMKTGFINNSMGSGDILLFLFLAFTFSTSAFITVFVFSLCFSLLLHLYLKNKSVHKSIPLAGYISLFFSAVYLVDFFVEPKYLFS